MIYRRKEGDTVRRGLNILWEPKAKGLILSTPWFSLYVDWNRHTRRVKFSLPFGFNWRAPLGPWARIRNLEQQVDQLEFEVRALSHALKQSSERYDNIRSANHQLRDALALYRSEV